MGLLVVVEGDPGPDACPCLRSVFPSVQIDVFILQGPPEAFDEDIVQAEPLAVHRDPGADPFQPVCPGEGRELAALIRVHDLGEAELVDRLVQRLDAEVIRPCSWTDGEQGLIPACSRCDRPEPSGQTSP